MATNDAARKVVTNIKLVPVCVNVGDAIFICIDYNYGGTITKHCYLVDGSLGGGGDTKSLVQESKNELTSRTQGTREEPHKGVTNLAKPVIPISNTDYLKLTTAYRQLTTTEGFVLKGIIVTHPDQDHYQGIRYLLQMTREINCPVLMTNRFLQERLRQKGVCEFLQVLEITHVGKHVRKDQEGDEHELVRLGFPKFFEFWHSEIGLVVYTLRDQYFPKRITERALDMPGAGKSLTPADDNKTSIVTTIRNPDSSEEVLACLTGDAVLKTVVKPNDYFKAKHLCVFQVPHHGSNNNSGVDLYKQIADRNPECIYFISCGTKSHGQSRTPFPHKQVLQSICTANRDNKSVRIILTSNKHLHFSLMQDIGCDPNKVLIYYWDEHAHGHQPYLYIPLSASIDLTSIQNLIEWSIQGYTAMIKKIPNKRSHQYSFYLQHDSQFWTIDTTKFRNSEFPMVEQKNRMHGIDGIPPPWSPSERDTKSIIILTDEHYEVLLNSEYNDPIILEKIENPDHVENPDLDENTRNLDPETIENWKIYRCHQTTWQIQNVGLSSNSWMFEGGEAETFQLTEWSQET